MANKLPTIKISIPEADDSVIELCRKFMRGYTAELTTKEKSLIPNEETEDTAQMFGINGEISEKSVDLILTFDESTIEYVIQKILKA